jgi:hypothetical protein
MESLIGLLRGYDAFSTFTIHTFVYNDDHMPQFRFVNYSDKIFYFSEK